MSKKNILRPQQFQESIEFAESRTIDREKGVVQNVKIIGTKSRNPRDYTEDALKRAVPLYEGVRVNIDHGGNELADGVKRDRSYRDRFGVLKRVRFEGDGLYADFHYNPKHQLAEQFAWDVENQPTALGFSHIAFGRGKRRGDRYVVEHIETVRSVDLVSDPATTRSLFESDQTMNEEDTIVKTTLKALLESHKTNPRAGRLWKLIEEELPMMAEMPMEAPAEDVPAEDAIWQAFRSAVIGVLDDDEMDIPTRIKRIGEILKSYEKLEEKPAEEKTSETSETPAGGETAESASLRSELAQIKAKLAKQEGETAAYRLLQESRLPANPAWVKAIAALPESDRKAFVESLPRGTHEAPRSSMPLSESTSGGGSGRELPKTAKEFAASIKD